MVVEVVVGRASEKRNLEEKNCKKNREKKIKNSKFDVLITISLSLF